jgi:hypothetical protein
MIGAGIVSAIPKAPEAEPSARQDLPHDTWQEAAGRLALP